MSSVLIRGQADANDVSPSGKLMLKYRLGRTIRAARSARKRARTGETCTNGQDRAGRNDIVISINESSGEILRRQEYPAQQIGQRAEGMSDERERVAEAIRIVKRVR